MSFTQEKLMKAPLPPSDWDASQYIHPVYEDDDVVRRVSCDSVSGGYEVYSWEVRKELNDAGERIYVDLDILSFSDDATSEELTMAILKLARRALFMQSQHDHQNRLMKRHFK